MDAGADAVMVVSRDDAWPLRVALLARHLEPDVPIIATIFDPETARELEERDRQLHDHLAGRHRRALARRPLPRRRALRRCSTRATARSGLRCSDGEVEVAPRCPRCARAGLARSRRAILHAVRPQRGAACSSARSGCSLVLVVETIAAALVLEQEPGRRVLRRGQDARHRRPEPGGSGRAQSWFKVVVSVSMLVALLFAAAFTGGLVERLIGRRLTGLVGRRAVPRSDHVVVVGLGQVGLRLALLLRRMRHPGGRDRRPGGRRERRPRPRSAACPVVIGRGADPSLLERLSLDRAIALAAVTNDDLQNIAVTLAARAPRAGPAARPARGLATPPRARRARSSGSATCATCTGSAPSTSPGSRSGRPPRTSSSTARPPTCATRTGRSSAAHTPSRVDSARPPPGLCSGGHFTSRVWAMVVGWTRQTSLYVPFTLGATAYVPARAPQSSDENPRGRWRRSRCAAGCRRSAR